MSYEFNSVDQLIRTLQALGIEGGYTLIDEIEGETYGVDADLPTYFPEGSHKDSFDTYSTFDADDYEYQQSLC